MLYLCLLLCFLAFYSVFFWRDYISALFVVSVLPPFLSLLIDENLRDSISGKEYVYIYVAFSVVGSCILVNQLLPRRYVEGINLWSSRPSTVLLRLFVALFFASIPLIRSFIGVSYLEFQDQAFVVPPFASYLYSFFGIILISYFASMSRCSVYDILILSFAFMLPTLGYLIAGFRSPFLSQLIIVSSISVSLSLESDQKSTPSLLRFKLPKINFLASFRNAGPSTIFFALSLLLVLVGVPLISSLRAGSSFGSFIDLPSAFLGEISFGAFFSVEKLTKISSHNFYSFNFLCLLFSPVTPPFVPESLWTTILNVLGLTSSACLAFSSTVSSDIIPDSGGLGSASSFYADAYYYFAQLSVLPILLFYFLLLLSCRYICNSISLNRLTPLSLSLLVLLVTYSPQLLTSWRQSVYDLISLPTLIYFFSLFWAFRAFRLR